MNLIEPGSLILEVEPGDETGDAEGPAAVGLGVPLLQGGDVPTIIHG